MFPREADAAATFQTATLEWIKAAGVAHLSPYLIESLDLRAEVVPELGRQLVAQLTAHVLADKLPPERLERSETVTLDVPATWWQAWKAEHPRLWRGWLAERWPVRMITHERTARLVVDLTRYVTYPEQHHLSPKLGDFVRVALVDSRVDWRDWRVR